MKRIVCHRGDASSRSVAALGVGQALVEQHASTAQAKGAVQAPRFEVDPMWPKPLPNGWYLGQTIGVWVDAQDHVWIIHRADSLDAVRPRPTEAADRRVLQEGAADHRVRSGGQPAPPLGRQGRSGLSVARVEPRHLRSTARATSGSAATAATTATC